jgi:hypothetical protein
MAMVPAADLSFRATALAAALAVVAVSCSSQPVAHEPGYSAADAAHRALAQYDKNHDGVLDVSELEQCPALKDLLKELDQSKSDGHRTGYLSAAEIENRLVSFQKKHIALLGIRCLVLLDDSPLAEATVTLVPEGFMGPEFKPASGVTDAEGWTRFQTEGQEYPGVTPGYYRVQVSKKDAGQREMLPTRYNTQSILGKEVSPYSRGGSVIKLKLSS